ncbi:hypothetical protein LTR10_016695 [Elasticomyces elasticus]|uniref:Anaphase-promoting complex subunit 4 WD40 domain-containing protein n=1 Tax=Exophiala sideris TaxID=1016849 RepID=A0ABR0JQJ8_9EURO|nr:hypothetical protein LTR10_016695 [Elasticomyces elasticus]KAK5039867.1 hypothetical protein LTS07_000362 [Exophiala sideris]KAK5041419.1 hypothetical protein LTR13_002894 [Exophiala sideris]KAK5068246.1 hypothetical protein LTR69_000364 [Exophiala sideris]KAK5187547.1 hypothetical protein LTR44_000363 [Eurotiomycetes sp. CCFEE 6388]
MLNTYREVGSCAPSRHNDVYIFSIAPLARDGLAAITSANELLLLQDRGNLGTSSVSVLSDCPEGVTSLVVADAGQTAFCAGSDGHVAVYDYRSRAKAAEFRLGFKALNAIACRGTEVAVGGDAVVSVWDRRQTRVRWQNTELNDEITALNFHPTQDNVLLAGGDDGLVSIFDTQIAEEEDSLLQAVNHGPIHKAGFLGTTDLYALSSDQNLALHSLTLEDTDATEPSPDLLGDLRTVIPCEYVIDVFQTGPDYVVACGSHSKSRVDLVKLSRGSGFDLSQRIVLEGAHGEEVVRSIFADDATGTIFTAGEDGRIAAFRQSEGQSVSSPASTTLKLKKGLTADARYKPY